MTQSMTQKSEYTERLARLEGVFWKRLIPVQAPYRWFLRSLKPGRVLEIGCGIGRNLRHLHPSIVGVDHNADSIASARAQGLKAFTVEEFERSKEASTSYEMLLVSHVIEHMNQDQAKSLIRNYLPMLQDSGRVVVICPQEAGYASDSTHVEFMDLAKISKILQDCGLQVERQLTFPFPSWFGKFFKYNEFIAIGRKSGPKATNS